MKKKRFTEEQIVGILRDAEASTIEKAARQHGVSEQSIYRWKRQFAQMEVADVRELRQLRQENVRLKKVLAERDLEVEVMKELQAKKWSAHGHGDKWLVSLVLVGFECAAPPGSVRLHALVWAISLGNSSEMPDWLKPSAAWASAIRSGGTA